MQDDWVKAVICIFLAALFDGLDGRVARFLKASSKFGAELDSLSDFVSFGVAPAILMYQWTLFDLPKFGWFFCLLFAMGMAMRLARFNTMLEDNNQPEYWSHYFVGVPAPAAAALAIMPILITFDFPESEAILRSNTFCSILMFLVAFLMVSRIPTMGLRQRIYPDSFDNKLHLAPNRANDFCVPENHRIQHMRLTILKLKITKLFSSLPPYKPNFRPK